MANEVTGTARDGSFAFDITATVGRGILLRVSADGYLPVYRQIPAQEWSPDKPIELELKMRHGSFTVAGYLSDEYGMAVTSSLVQETSTSSKLHVSTQTVENGYFELKQILAANDYRLIATSSSRYRPLILDAIKMSYGMAELQ